MNVIQEVEQGFHSLTHGGGGKHKALIYGGVVVAAAGFYWFFLRGKLGGSSATPSNIATGVPVGGGGGPYYPIPVTTPKKKKKRPGKPVHKHPKAPVHGHTPVHARLPKGRHHNHGQMNHPYPSHGHVVGQRPSRRSFLEALGIVKRERRQIANLREQKAAAAVTHNVRRERNLRARILKDRRTVQGNRQTIIRYRHPNDSGYLWSPNAKPKGHPAKRSHRRAA